MNFFKKLNHKMDMGNENLNEQCHLDDLIEPETKINSIYVGQSDIHTIEIDKFVSEGLSIGYSNFHTLELIKSYTTKIRLKGLHSNFKLNDNICCRDNVIDSLDTIRKEIINPDDIDTNIPINKCNVGFNKIDGHTFTIKDLYIKEININYSNFHTINLINLNLDTLKINFSNFHSIFIQNCNIKNIKVKNSELHGMNMCLDSTVKNIDDKCSTFKMSIYHPLSKEEESRYLSNGHLYRHMHRDTYLDLDIVYKYNILTGKMEIKR